MKKLLLVLGFLTFALGSYAQSGQDFASFGDELLIQKNKVEIFPNPSVDYLNVHIKNSDLSKTELIIYNIIGSKFVIEVENVGPEEYRIDVQDLPRDIIYSQLKMLPAISVKHLSF